jgi:membrane protein implicated in regulation of membrane protease activity
MSRLIFFIVLIGAGWWFLRKFTKDAKNLASRSDAKRKEEMTGAQGTLVQDPKTGEYRVKRADE